jgi:hypothetical protein
VACNDRYDQITNHGRNLDSEAEAADREPAGGKPASC